MARRLESGWGQRSATAGALVALLSSAGCEDGAPRAEPVGPEQQRVERPAGPAATAATAARPVVVAAPSTPSTSRPTDPVSPPTATAVSRGTAPPAEAPRAGSPRSTVAESPAPPPTPTPPPAPEPDPAPPVTSPKVGEANFKVWAQSSGRYKAGQPGVVEVVLVPSGAFHTNDKYPYKFKLGAASPGVSYPQPIVRSEGLTRTPSRAVMRVPFVPASPGDARIAGTFSFSVCTDTQCVIDSRELALTVKVD